MVKFAGTPAIVYSDMNRYGPYVTSSTRFNLYWFLASLFLLIVSSAFYVRGSETAMKKRFRSALTNLKSKAGVAIAVFLLWVLCVGFVFYNTEVLNHYDSGKVTKQKLGIMNMHTKSMMELPNLVTTSFYTTYKFFLRSVICRWMPKHGCVMYRTQSSKKFALQCPCSRIHL